MINHLLLIFSSIIIYEFLRYVQPIDIVRSNLKIYQKIQKLFKFKKASDFRKEKLILDYSKSLFIVSIKIFAILISIFIFMLIINLLSNSYLNLVVSILGMIELSIVFITYHLIRKNLMQNYSGIQKFLHDFVLSKQFINKSLFELEKIIYLKNKDIINQSNVFITGLPRSGTTILLNFLFSSNEYASLTYRNMPFILSPHFSKLINKRNVPKKERLHADGITFDINSPEALDEIFFNNNKEFVKNELVNYIQLILLSEKKEKYLSKNNLNFKRIDLIHSILPNSIFLIPIREPLQHAYSLLNQHLHFSRLQKEDDYIRRYMNYLGHNEFGLDHKSWNNPIHFKDLNNINYWLEQWCLFYKNILKNYQNYNNCFFIIYEELTNPNYVKMLLEKINLNQVKKLNSNYFKNSNKKEIDIDYAKDIYDNAKDIYDKLKQK